MKKPSRPIQSLRYLIAVMLAFAVTASAQLVPDPLAAYAARVDAAVDKGLEYLASVQREDGSFPGRYGRSAGVVGLGGMAFLSKGYTPLFGRYAETINRCIDYCIGMQETKSGYMGGHRGRMYGHNIATLFLLEVSGMVAPDRQKKLDDAIARAVRLIVSAQQIDKHSKHQGGWRYTPTSKDSDLSCSGWAVMALRSARLNGARIPDQAIDDATAYVWKRFDSRKGSFGYQDTDRFATTLTGVGLLSLELGGHHGETRMLKAADYLMADYRNLPRKDHFLYGLYYTAQATFQIGGKYWERFAPWMVDYWLPKQRKDGSWRGEAGQWESHETAYYTAMSILSFTVPYRQLPIYQRDETVDEEPDAGPRTIRSP